MSQTLLPFKYEISESTQALTPRAGLLLYLDMMTALELTKSIRKYLRVTIDNDQGWLDEQMIPALILLQLSGGDCVEDIDKLESDRALTTIMSKTEAYTLSRRERRVLAKRFRKGRERVLPSISAIRRYLEEFHAAEEEAKREPGKAFIPAPNEHLRGLLRINAGIIAKVQSWRPRPVATLDMDATLAEVHKASALYCYKHFKAYQPLNVWWAEHEMTLHSEFRDGNVPAGYEQLRVLIAALNQLPNGVQKVYMRSDSAGYEWSLLRYCAEGKHPRFGKIEFAVSCDVNEEFKKAVRIVPEGEWYTLYRQEHGQSIDTGQQWCEVCFVPNKGSTKKRGPEYRFLAIREPMRQLELPGVEKRQGELPFQTIELGEEGQRYKLFGVVTNRDIPGEELIWWHRERCGRSEQAHDVMKNELAGGTLPSRLFGANAAWWGIMILAFNIHAALKQLALGESWARRRMKAIRFAVINIAGRLVTSGRYLRLKLSGEISSLQLLLDARHRMWELVHGPSG